MSDGFPSTVLHYTGYDNDRGGVISVVRGLAGSGRFDCALGVNAGFAPQRNPPLATIPFPRIEGETIGPGTFWRSRAVAQAARAWLRQDSARVFHAHSRAGLLVAWWLWRWGERRIVVSVHCYGRQRWFYRWAARQLGGRLYWLSPAMKRYYGVRTTGDPWAQCIPGCITVPRDAEQRAASARTPDMLRLGGIGALVRWKGWHLIVEALAELPPTLRQRVRFAHIGSADDTAEAQRYATELRTLTATKGLDDVIAWRGEQPSSAGLLREIDCLIVASDHEPFSIAVLEALAAGVPVLAADSGGAQDLLTEGRTGWFFRTGSAESLAEKITMLLETDALSRVRIGRELVEPFTASTIAARWAKVYAELEANEDRPSSAWPGRR